MKVAKALLKLQLERATIMYGSSASHPLKLAHGCPRRGGRSCALPWPLNELTL